MVVEKIYIADKPTQDQIKQGVDTINAQIADKAIGKVLKSQTFTSNGYFTVPVNVSEVYLTGGGAGGGGALVVSTSSFENGHSGTPTSFGNILTLSGGGGGVRGTASDTSSSGGVAGGPGGQGGQGYSQVSGNANTLAGNGGDSGFYKGGYGSKAMLYNTSMDGSYCAGGAGAFIAGGFATGGGGGDFVIDKVVNVSPQTTIPITIGVGGKGGDSVNLQMRAGNGGNGILTVKWWE